MTEFNIKMLNIQGLTNQKEMEIEMQMKEEIEIYCLTETHQKKKNDKLDLSSGLKKIEVTREVKDKKGGGLMLLYKSNKDVEITKINTKN